MLLIKKKMYYWKNGKIIKENYDTVSSSSVSSNKMKYVWIGLASVIGLLLLFLVIRIVSRKRRRY